MAIDKRFLKYLPGGIAAVLIIGISSGVIFTIRGWILDKPANTKKMVQQISLIQPPPPPPKLDKPPEPEIEQEQVELSEPEQAPEEMPDMANDQALGDLGLDADGLAGGDGFGLLGRKGGRSLLEGGPFGWYAGLIKQELHNSLYEHEDIRRETYSIIVKVWISNSGKVSKVELQDPTGNKSIDKSIMAALNSISSLSEAPPAEMPQPVVLRITSRS